MIVAKNIILGFLVLFFLFSLTKNLFEYRRNLEFYESYKTEYDSQKERNNILRAELVKTDDLYYIEKTIRDELNLLKANEGALMLPPQTPTPTVITPTPQPNYELWYETMFEHGSETTKN